MIDIEDPALESVVRRMVMKIIQELLSQQPPDSQIALMLHAHIRDFSEFRCEVRQKFEQVDGRLDRIEKNMATKEDLERFATKEDLDTGTAEIKKDLERFATKEDLDTRTAEIKKDLERFATKEDLDTRTAEIKKDLERFATKEDLNNQTIKIIDAVRNLLGKP
ncbi:hypothetical protein CCP4SC76_3500003 [Gammaproteobacteria bacterium]